MQHLSEKNAISGFPVSPGCTEALVRWPFCGSHSLCWRHYHIIGFCPWTANCCFEVSCDLCLTFNCGKSSCFAIGKGNKLRISDMNLRPNSIEWCDSFKYLGVTFQAGLKLKINIDMIKQKFFYGGKQCVG